jgi:hypothetical protein
MLSIPRKLSIVDFNGRTTTFAYDGLNRLLSRTPDASFGENAISFSYTATGQRQSMTDASGLTTCNCSNCNVWVASADVHHLFAFANDDPANFIDPLGLDGVFLVAATSSYLRTPPDGYSCAIYRDGTGAGDILYQICMHAGNNSWSNCVRGGLLSQFIPLDNPFGLVFRYGLVDHLLDFAVCATER